MNDDSDFFTGISSPISISQSMCFRFPVKEELEEEEVCANKGTGAKDEVDNDTGAVDAMKQKGKWKYKINKTNMHNNQAY